MLKKISMSFLFILISIIATSSFSPLNSQTHDSAMWEKNIKAFEDADKTSPPKPGSVLFIGSSSIALWKTLAEDMAPIPVINRGFGGSWIRDSIAFADRIVLPYKPSKIVFYAGENDIASGVSPAVVGADFERFVGINTETVRERCGRCLAKYDKDCEIDYVAGIPDSGMGYAIGYAMESGKPLRRPLVKYTPGYGRSYTPPKQATRDLVARMKLIPIHEIIENQRIAICEDSIVRGTQLKNHTIQKLWDSGVKEIHVRVACPPLMFPCKFAFSTRNIQELVARRAIQSIEGSDIENFDEYLDPLSEKYNLLVDWITKELNVTTLRYLNLEDMVSAIGMPKDQLCLYCWNGKYPYNSFYEDEHDQIQLNLE